MGASRVRRRSLALAIALCVLAGPIASRAADPAARNVVLIVMDETGVDLFGAYGEVKPGMSPPPEHGVTPNIQALTDAGVIFRNAWAGQACSATRATIVTGQYAFRNGVGAAIPSLPEPGSPAAYIPLAQRLGEAPAPRPARSLIGKWHITDFSQACDFKLTPLTEFYYTPVEGGFTQYQGFPDTGGYSFGWCEVVEGTGSTEPCEDPLSPGFCGRSQYNTTYEIDRAVAFLAGAPVEPWFLEVALHAVHVPRQAPPEGLHTQAYIIATYDEADEIGNTHPDSRPMQEAMLEAMDTELGRFMAALHAHDPGLANTTVILVGDNGSVLPLDTAVNRGKKGMIYEGGINVPLVVAGDAVSPLRVGTETAALVHSSDLYPTILEMTGKTPPAGITIDGVSFARHLNLAAANPPRSCVYADGRFPGAQYGQPRSQHDTAVRNATHKLIRFANTSAGVTGYEFYGRGPDGHLDENAALPIPSDPEDPSYASYQALHAQLQDTVASPCKPVPPPPSCGFGPELAALPLLLASLQRIRSRVRSRHS